MPKICSQLSNSGKIKRRGIRGGFRGDLRGKENYPPRQRGLVELY
jgi:hypothetical protein